MHPQHNIFSLLKDFWPLLAISVTITLIMWFYSPRQRHPERRTIRELSLTARRPLSAFEEQMYFVLVAALPECIILAQVSFSALVNADQRMDRNYFDRKFCDYLVCSKKLTPITIIELDDRSHDRKKAQDADRDAMMKRAGYHTIRYNSIPSMEEIQVDIENVLKRLTIH